MNIQRTFGKLTVKSEGHDAKVQILLDEFEQADQVLARFIDAMNAWREAWTSVLGVQWNLATTYEGTSIISPEIYFDLRSNQSSTIPLPVQVMATRMVKL